MSPTNPISQSTANIDLITRAAAKGREAALIVPYGKGKIYLANRQAKVAAYLPTKLAKFFNLAKPSAENKPYRVVREFIEYDETVQRGGDSGRATGGAVSSEPSVDYVENPTRSLEQLYNLAGQKGIKRDAELVPYGHGKFYIANRESKVAAYLPNAINRFLKLAPPRDAAKQLQALAQFRELLIHQYGASSDKMIDPGAKKLTVGLVSEAEGRDKEVRGLGPGKQPA